MLRTILAGVLLIAVSSVAMADTRVDFDRHRDFSRYKTFTLEVLPPVRADGVVDEENTLAERRLRQAVTREFHARGLEETEFGADLTVRVSSREVERTDVRGSGWEPYPWGTWGFHPRWGYYRRPWGYWGRYGYGGDVWTRRYIEGSVLIDVIDRDAGQLVYRAEVSDETGSNLDKFVTKTVDKAFKKFPVKETSD